MINCESIWPFDVRSGSEEAKELLAKMISSCGCGQVVFFDSLKTRISSRFSGEQIGGCGSVWLEEPFITSVGLNDSDVVAVELKDKPATGERWEKVKYQLEHEGYRPEHAPAGYVMRAISRHVSGLVTTYHRTPRILSTIGHVDRINNGHGGAGKR